MWVCVFVKARERNRVADLVLAALCNFSPYKHIPIHDLPSSWCIAGRINDKLETGLM